MCLSADLIIAVQWLPKSRDSLSFTKPHSSNQNHIRRLVPSQVWAVGLLPKSFWDRNGHGHGFLITSSQFWCILAVSNGLWAVIQKSVAWTVPELMVSGGMEGWDELEMVEQFENGRPVALVTFERMEATVPLFISENKTWCGLHQQQIYNPSLDSFSFWLRGAYGQAVHGCLSAGLLFTWASAVFLNQPNSI